MVKFGIPVFNYLIFSSKIRSSGFLIIRSSGFGLMVQFGFKPESLTAQKVAQMPTNYQIWQHCFRLFTLVALQCCQKGCRKSNHIWKNPKIHANLANRVSALSVLLLTRCISQTLGGLIAFRYVGYKSLDLAQIT